MSVTLSRRDKIRHIFDKFDADGDGALNNQELSAFITAVNPSVNFTSSQIQSIIQEIFRSYPDFISNPNLGLSLAGLIQTYKDGAGDVDIDFANLSPSNQDQQINIHDNPISEISCYTSSSVNAVEDLERAIKLRARSVKSKDFIFIEGLSDTAWSTDISSEPKNNNSKEFMNELKEIRERIDGLVNINLVFDGHVAIGKVLHDKKIFKEAVISFQRAAELKPLDIRAHYGLGNSLMMLGHCKKAKETYLNSLKLAESDSVKWSDILPQIHMNLGILMEGEGLLFNACEHYREAAILCPTHYRALKLLGSALYGVGECGPAQKALEEAVVLKPEFADAHCDLGSVLYAIGEEERAVMSFQRAIDLKNDHVEALYNLGSLFKDVGRYQRAAEMYRRVLAIVPEHWRAWINLTVALMGAGEEEEARSSLNRAFKITGHVELFDAHKQLNGCGVSWVVEDDSKFVIGEKNMNRSLLADALWIRALQKETKLGRCKVDMLQKEIETLSVRTLRKSEVEIILRKVLHFLKAETFRCVLKSMDEKIWTVLDATSTGKIDFAVFIAIIALICEGPSEKRKLVAYNALSSQSFQDDSRKYLSRTDFAIYLKYLRLVYFPSQGFTDLMGLYEGDEEESKEVSLHEFSNKLEDEEYGFRVMSTLVKLEGGKKRLKRSYYCGVCRYRISGLMFKETTAGFSLCPSCYSDGKVPLLFHKELYKFKEYNTGQMPVWFPCNVRTYT